MADQAPCPRCRHANPPENRFCGSCGAPLGTGSDLVARREGNLTVMGHALTVKPGPVSKALAVGLGTLAVRAGLSWLRNRTTAENQSSALSAPFPPPEATKTRSSATRVANMISWSLKATLKLL